MDLLEEFFEVLRTAQKIANQEDHYPNIYVYKDRNGAWKYTERQEALPNLFHPSTNGLLVVDRVGYIRIEPLLR